VAAAAAAASDELDIVGWDTGGAGDACGRAGRALRDNEIEAAGGAGGGVVEERCG